MTDQIVNDAFSPDVVLRSVQEAACFFLRDTVEHLPSGDEVRQLQAKGIKWRWIVAGYISDGHGGSISAFATTNDIKPPDDWQENAYRKVVVILANAFMKRLIERQQKAEAEKKIVEVAP